MIRFLFVSCLLSVVASATSSRSAETKTPWESFADPADETEQFHAEPVVAGLARPCGLAFRPGAPEGVPAVLYFSEAGAGRVVRVDLDDSPAPIPAIIGFPTRTVPSLGGANLGPLGTAFLTRAKLAVAEAGSGAIRVYSIDEVAPAEYGAPDHAAGPVRGSPAGTGLFSLALLEDKALFAAGPEAPGATPSLVLKASLAANQLTDLQQFVPLAKLPQASAPTALAINFSPDSPYVVAGTAGEPGPQADSEIAFLSPRTGAKALALPCGLRDVVALAYSPGGQLYAADASWADPTAGGVYRIDAAMVAGRQACRPVKIASLLRPMSLAFGPDGVLYAAAWGSEENEGRLLRIAGEL